jgi:putative hydrolase of HD superfamily
MEHFLTELLPGDSAASARVRSLWEEYEAAETAEARFVKDLDRFELGLQAVEYEQGEPSSLGSCLLVDALCAEQGLDLSEFLESTQPKIQSDEVKDWSKQLFAQAFFGRMV